MEVEMKVGNLGKKSKAGLGFDCSKVTKCVCGERIVRTDDLPRENCRASVAQLVTGVDGMIVSKVTQASNCPATQKNNGALVTTETC